ncbi:MAG TPA: Ig-like domain-containing protein [Brumimicrobium sp.]|nr:Ig-like domain-containing protein [Brumimicrobium sp.]
MTRISFIISLSIVLFLLLTSCGQVGTITGGERDTTSPQIITKNVQPPMGSINISPQEIRIPFDEYIELNKPAENISVTPADVKFNYTIKNKSLVLIVKEGNWKPNTTYTIYLNRAVRDITEFNDSIIAYVFSTGSFLDSLQTAVQVNDAYTNQPVEGLTVGLYTAPLLDDTSKIEPRYYASTNAKGIAQFKNVKDTVFYVYAFNDENRNNRLGPTEKRAILRKPAVLDTSLETGPIIRLMPPQNNTLQIVSNEVLPTASWCIGFNRELKDNENFEFLAPQPSHVIWNKEKDSLTAFYETTKNTGSFSGILHNEHSKDTLIKKYAFKESPKLEVKTHLDNKKLSIRDSLTLILNEPLRWIDTNEIVLFGIKKEDSAKHAIDYTIDSISPIEIRFSFDRKKQEKLFLNIPPQALQGLNFSLTDSLNLDFTLQEAKETGTMIVEFDTLPEYGILYITHQQTKKEYKVNFDGIEKTNHRLDFMDPGEYSFHYLVDKDKNGTWTTGSLFEELDAEKVIWFPVTSTIRANWEVKTTLPIKKKES